MIKRIEPGPRMSQAVVHGDTVYTAGQVASDTSADVYGQARQILTSIDRLLAAAGTDKTRLLSATLRDIIPVKPDSASALALARS